MPSNRIQKSENEGMFFLTFTVWRWYYIFDRHNRFDILSKVLNFYLAKSRIKVYAYVFMLNHIHLIVYSDDIIGFVRDYKRYVSKSLEQNILETEPHVLRLFKESGSYEFWQKTIMPEKIWNEYYYEQKVNYIHNNPVKKTYVFLPEHWYWSSANPDSEVEISELDERYFGN